HTRSDRDWSSDVCSSDLSATQDIVIDAFRIETLDEREQAAGMAAYVAAYRIGMLVSTAGALFLVSAFEDFGSGRHAAWTWGYVRSEERRVGKEWRARCPT